MKYCKNCKVKIDGERNYCPLCFREVESIDDKTSTPLFSERKTNETNVQRGLFVTKLFVFMSVCAISICLLVNYFTGFKSLWSLSVVSGITYVWILISHTIISRRGIFEKVLFQLLGIMFILWTSELISVGHTWLPNYVFPSVSLCTICSLLMITFIRKDKSWILSFLTITFILSVVSLVIMIRQPDEFMLLNLINVVLGGLSVLGYFTFGFNAIKQEFLKNFHL